MTKEEKITARRVAIGVSLLVLILSVLVFYLFFYRERSVFVEKDYFPAKRVLFISSYSESFDTVDLQKEGIRQAFKGNNIQLDIEYMDMKRFDRKENEDLFYQSLQYKIKNSKAYDAILLGDDAALKFAMAHQEELFAGISMVFFCINDKELAITAGENPYITGAVEELYLKDTIDIAIKFQPKATKVAAIYDNTLTGKGDWKQFNNIKSSYPEYEFVGINASEYTLDEFGQILGRIEDDTILIFMDQFEDIDNNYYTIFESVRYITERAKVPVYRVSVSGVGDGLIGGRMVSYDKSGYMAAAMVLDLLKGVDIADMPVYLTGESQYYFDYNILRKYDIDLSLVPDDTVIVNKEPTIFEKYKVVLIPVFVFSLFCLCVSLVIVIDSLKRRLLMKDLQRSNEYILYQAEHDYLTNLPNRRAAMEKIELLIHEKKECTVIIMDIDDFKEINDSYGHICGDEVLREIAGRLLEITDDKLFYVSRFGGDEFLLIMNGAEYEQNEQYMHRIKQVLELPVVFEDKKHYIKMSMGIAEVKGDETEASEIVSNMDFALCTAKKSGKNEWVYYNVNMKDEAVKRKDIKNILNEACINDGFYILYQPQVDAGTGRTNGYEALIRLKNHLISPMEFISIAEETELILNIGRIVTKKVIEQMVEWRSNGLELYPVAINFSSKQIRDKGYVNYLKGLLEKNEISPHLIELEITESIFINNNENAMQLFEDFSAIGVGLALDDFGTGYSSINYLTYIPVEKIKLDKSLVDIFLDDRGGEFIENIIRMAHCLGLKVTVEGIEEKHQSDKVTAFGCDCIQGYYFSKPITGGEVALLKNPIKG
ncbi:ABC transporter substrate binding protein [Kineothrix sp. MB12-C1]|uniref:ABC transporter substrate binding protein n=1 Tax=Kineothrix sp. MB12-C1 TaxID=3070215 RepID=UPI0027D345C8|nr:ABC transporter substrate binding protein [Kineothrix sp. MB12-C1]WMC93901.1 ABC transporter substrate binding protein [Kineothrix sp. MB12-C1]